MNKSKLVAALATAGFLCLGGTAAQAQSEIWQGAWGQIGVGAATFTPGFSGGAYLNASPYSGATANTDSDSFGQASSSLSGYALGLGYKQVIRGGLYGYAELNYAKYKDVDVPYAQLSGEINATGMDVAVGIGWKF